jgi:predicted metal-dependent HD superfamily phosphohydrolase
MTDLERWRAAWAGLGLSPPEGLLEQLLARYGQPHRAYHTMQHLHECFGHFDQAAASAQHPDEVTLALWFHDAIYDPADANNEEASAEWAERVIAGAGGGATVQRRVRDLILATRHEAPPAPGDAALLADIDLAILGAERARFDEYETQVRREYAFVPEIVFRTTRKKVLEGLLARPTIYRTRRFIRRFEWQARVNLAGSISRLGG